VIPGLYPTGFMISVTVDGNGTPILTNNGAFPLIIYKKASSNELRTTVVLSSKNIELELNDYLQFAVTVFGVHLNPLVMTINLKVQPVVNTNGYNYCLYINPNIK